MTDENLLLEYYPIIFEDAVEYDHSIWFAASSFNGIFRMNHELGDMEYIGQLPLEDRVGLCSSVRCYNGKLYFVPCNAEKIIEFDVQTREYDSYTVPYKYGGFYGAGQYQNYIYFWSYEKFVIVRFDMDNKKFLKIENTLMDIKVGSRACMYHDGYWSFALVRDFCIVQDHLFIPSSAIGVVLDIDMKAGSMQVWEVEGTKGFHTICFDGTGFWLAEVENRLMYWQPDKNVTKFIPIDASVRICDARMSICKGSKIFFSMNNSSEILTLDARDVKVRMIQDYKKENVYWTSELHTFKTVFMKEMFGKVWVMDSVDASLQTIENDNRVLYRVRLNAGINEFIRDRMTSYFLRVGAEQDFSGYQLPDYIKILLCSYKDGNMGIDVGVVKRSVGEQIHCEVKKTYGTED